MANQLDLLTVVKNKLADVREKTVQLADAQLALDASRSQLTAAQQDLSEHIESLKTLASEISSELSFETLSEVKEDAVADSLKVVETAADETLIEDEELAETAVSDESPTSKKAEVKAATSKAPASRNSVAKSVPVEDEDSSTDDEDEVEELISKPSPAPKTTATVGGLWDDDDDDEVF